MKNSYSSQENKKASNGSGRVDLKTVEAPPKAKTPPQNVSGKEQPPNQPVSQRFPALEKQETIFTFFSLEAREVAVAGNFNGWNPLGSGRHAAQKHRRGKMGGALDAQVRPV
jgi:hypothetical protein